MTAKKKTAVMWLLENYKEPDAINKALQMEREQIGYDYSCGVIHAIKNPDKIDHNQYYTDTYGE